MLDLETKETIKTDFKVEQFKMNFLELNKSIFQRMLGRIVKYIKIAKYVKLDNYDYVVFFNLNLLPLVFLCNKKTVYSVREYNPKIFDSKIISLFLKKLTLITTNNLPSYILLERKYKNVLLQNNVIDFVIPQNLDIKVEEKNYLIVSNFSKRKNILPAIETFINLKDKGYKLRIAGGIEDEKYYENAKKIIKRNGRNIEILGFLTHEELEKEYLKSEGIIHLSRLEGTPNALLDAVKYKKKFIALSTPENLSLFPEAKDFLIDDISFLINRYRRFQKVIIKSYFLFSIKSLKKLFLDITAKSFMKR